MLRPESLWRGTSPAGALPRVGSTIPDNECVCVAPLLSNVQEVCGPGMIVGQRYEHHVESLGFVGFLNPGAKPVRPSFSCASATMNGSRWGFLTESSTMRQHEPVGGTIGPSTWKDNPAVLISWSVSDSGTYRHLSTVYEIRPVCPDAGPGLRSVCSTGHPELRCRRPSPANFLLHPRA